MGSEVLLLRASLLHRGAHATSSNHQLYTVRTCTGLFGACSIRQKTLLFELAQCLVSHPFISLPSTLLQVVDHLNHEGRGIVEFLDYLTYVPLFVEIHDSICGNPLDVSRTK